MAELTKTQVSEKVKKALDWIVADSTTKANNAKTQAINDAATKYRRLNDNIYMASNAAGLHISGGTSWDQGACLVLNGKESSSGSFWLTAKSPTAESVLSATATGSLTWQSKNIVRSVNGKSANASGDVSVPTRAVGDQWISVDGTIPAGGLPFLGQTVGRSAYSALFSWAQSQGRVKSESEWQSISASNNGNVPYYSSGDGSTTFRLPNITGTTFGEQPEVAFMQYLDGAFYRGDTSNNSGLCVDTDSDNSKIHFDASRSNPIYGRSNHVTPETQTVLIGVYAFGEVGVTGSATTDALASNLAKVEASNTARGLFNTTVVGASEAWYFAPMSCNILDLKLLIHGDLQIDANTTYLDTYSVLKNDVEIGTFSMYYYVRRTGGAGFGRKITTSACGTFYSDQLVLTQYDKIKIVRKSGNIPWSIIRDSALIMNFRK